MGRLGELLVAAGLLDADKLEQALRAQIVWGGRLGTNLVELGFIDLDELSRALGRLHGVPAALARHFEKADPVLQRRILTPSSPTSTRSSRWSSSPTTRSRSRAWIRRTTTRAPRSRTSSASRRPTSSCRSPPSSACATSSSASTTSRAPRVICARAASRSLHFRSSATSRARRTPISRSRSTGTCPHRSCRRRSCPCPCPSSCAVERPATQPDALAALIDRAIAATPPTAEPAGRERRTYVKTLADDVQPDEPAVASEPPAPNTLGRIAIRKVAIGSREVRVARGREGDPARRPPRSRRRARARCRRALRARLLRRGAARRARRHRDDVAPLRALGCAAARRRDPGRRARARAARARERRQHACPRRRARASSIAACSTRSATGPSRRRADRDRW